MTEPSRRSRSQAADIIAVMKRPYSRSALDRWAGNPDAELAEDEQVVLNWFGRRSDAGDGTLMLTTKRLIHLPYGSLRKATLLSSDYAALRVPLREIASVRRTTGITGFLERYGHIPWRYPFTVTLENGLAYDFSVSFGEVFQSELERVITERTAREKPTEKADLQIQKVNLPQNPHIRSILRFARQYRSGAIDAEGFALNVYGEMTAIEGDIPQAVRDAVALTHRTAEGIQFGAQSLNDLEPVLRHMEKVIHDHGLD